MSTITLETLALRARNGSERETTSWMSRPFRIERGTEAWTAATNGHLILAVPEDIGAEPYPNINNGAYMVGWLADERPGSSLVGGATVSRLLEWTRIRPATDDDDTDCKRCYGSGSANCVCPDCQHEHFAPCRECSETGLGPRAVNIFNLLWICDWPGPQREFPLRLFGSDGPLVDATRLFYALHGLPDGPVTVEWGPKGTEQVRICGQGWTAIVMPIQEIRP